MLFLHPFPTSKNKQKTPTYFVIKEFITVRPRRLLHDNYCRLKKKTQQKLGISFFHVFSHSHSPADLLARVSRRDSRCKPLLQAANGPLTAREFRGQEVKKGIALGPDNLQIQAVKLAQWGPNRLQRILKLKLARKLLLWL